MLICFVFGRLGFVSFVVLCIKIQKKTTNDDKFGGFSFTLFVRK